MGQEVTGGKAKEQSSKVGQGRMLQLPVGKQWGELGLLWGG